jgi:hypothetical protein
MSISSLWGVKLPSRNSAKLKQNFTALLFAMARLHTAGAFSADGSLG